MTKLERQSLWKTRISEFKASGLSVQVWCANQDVKPYQLWYWLRKDRDVFFARTFSTKCFQPSNLSAKPAIYVTVGGGKKSDILRH